MLIDTILQSLPHVAKKGNRRLIHIWRLHFSEHEAWHKTLHIVIFKNLEMEGFGFGSVSSPEQQAHHSKLHMYSRYQHAGLRRKMGLYKPQAKQGLVATGAYQLHNYPPDYPIVTAEPSCLSQNTYSSVCSHQQHI
eukprot:1286614-Amphidinium_carterae.1